LSHPANGISVRKHHRNRKRNPEAEGAPPHRDSSGGGCFQWEDSGLREEVPSEAAKAAHEALAVDAPIHETV
jgi:hypothetical protein